MCGANNGQEALGGALYPLEYLKNHTSFIATKVAGTGTFSRCQFRYINQSIGDLAGFDFGLNTTANIPTIPNDAAYFRFVVIAKGYSFAGCTIKITLN